jgi:Arc/MetJ-type ribon-helix-helix transcriptional regulator
MRSTKIAVTIDTNHITRLDRRVKSTAFPSSSAFIGHALSEKLRCLSHTRPARECAKLDRNKGMMEADLRFETHFRTTDPHCPLSGSKPLFLGLEEVAYFTKLILEPIVTINKFKS